MQRRLTELAGALSLATDLAHGAPPEHQLKVAVLCARAAGSLGLDPETARDAFDAGLLRWLGCTAVAQPLSALFGDEIAAHQRGARFDGPLDPLLEILRYAGSGRPLPQRAVVLAAALGSGPAPLFAATCEAAATVAERLGYSEAVVEALGLTFERVDGKGWPGRLSGTAIPVAARIAAAAEDLVTLTELLGGEAASAELVRRVGHQHEATVAGAVLGELDGLEADFLGGDASALLAAADPAPGRVVAPERIEDLLLTVADLIDLKVPSRAGHSRAVADLAAAAAAAVGVDPTAIRQAALVHAIGDLSVSNDVWARAGNPSSADAERLRLAPHHTDRIWARCSWLAATGALASQYAERLDGSGYHRGLSGPALSAPARLLQAAKQYRSWTEERSYRPAYSAKQAATRLREETTAGRFDPEMTEAVIAAAGGRRRARRSRPDGLTHREVEVLALLAQGLPNKEIAGRLVVAPRTVGHHVAHIYDKIGVTTRAGATLYAVRHQLLDPAESVET